MEMADSGLHCFKSEIQTLRLTKESCCKPKSSASFHWGKAERDIGSAELSMGMGIENRAGAMIHFPALPNHCRLVLSFERNPSSCVTITSGISHATGTEQLKPSRRLTWKAFTIAETNNDRVAGSEDTERWPANPPNVYREGLKDWISLDPLPTRLFQTFLIISLGQGVLIARRNRALVIGDY